MADIDWTDEAIAELNDCPRPIVQRLVKIAERLENWPAVSGVKPLRGEWKGYWRIRTGDYRLIFKVSADDEVVVICKIGGRKDIYEE